MLHKGKKGNQSKKLLAITSLNLAPKIILASLDIIICIELSMFKSSYESTITIHFMINIVLAISDIDWLIWFINKTSWYLWR